MKTKLQAHIGLFFVSLLYAGNFTIAKEVMPTYVQPFGLIFLRVTAGFILFSIFHALYVKEKIQKKDLPLLALCGLLGGALNQLAFFKGLNWTTPINGALIMLTSPIFVIIVSAILYKEKIILRKIIGILIGCLGAGLLILYGTKLVMNENGWIGDLLILANAGFYATYLVLVKQLIIKYHPLTVIKWVFAFGLLYVTPVAINDVIMIEWSMLPLPIWLAIFYILVGVTFLTYLLNGLALKKVSATVVSAYVYLQPILATIIAISFGKDQLSWISAFSCILIFIAVYLISDFSNQK